MRHMSIGLACALLAVVSVSPSAGQIREARLIRLPLGPAPRVIPAKFWKKPPPVSLMQGLWTNEDPESGPLSRLVVNGTHLSAFVRGASGDTLLGETDARWYVGGPDSSWLFAVTRMDAVFETATAQVELALTLEKQGRLQVDELVRYPDSSSNLDRWHRYAFRGGPQASTMKLMSTVKIPEFPWPPPKASTRDVVPDGLATRSDSTETLGDIFDRITTAMLAAGFVGPAVYGIPDQTGFVIVTQLENIREDGRPLEDRFTRDPRPDRPRTIAEYLRALFDAPPGLYRVIALAVTNGVVTESEQEPTKDQAELWLHTGSRWLPPELRSKELAGARCEALIYEFRKPPEQGSEPTLWQDNLPALQHLAGAYLWVEALR